MIPPKHRTPSTSMDLTPRHQWMFYNQQETDSTFFAPSTSMTSMQSQKLPPASTDILTIQALFTEQEITRLDT